MTIENETDEKPADETDYEPKGTLFQLAGQFWRPNEFNIESLILFGAKKLLIDAI